jgi:hypothetical protein
VTAVCPPPWAPSQGEPPLRITRVEPICTAPDDIRLIVVKVETSEPAPGHRFGDLMAR